MSNWVRGEPPFSPANEVFSGLIIHGHSEKFPFFQKLRNRSFASKSSLQKIITVNTIFRHHKCSHRPSSSFTPFTPSLISYTGCIIGMEYITRIPHCLCSSYLVLLLPLVFAPPTLSLLLLPCLCFLLPCLCSPIPFLTQYLPVDRVNDFNMRSGCSCYNFFLSSLLKSPEGRTFLFQCMATLLNPYVKSA